QKGCVIEGPRFIAIQAIEHAICSRARLLNGREPLTEHACPTSDSVGCLNHVAGCINVCCIGAHGRVHSDAVSTDDAIAFNEINVWCDANCNEEEVAGNARATGCDDLCYLSLLANDLNRCFFGTYIYSHAALFLQHYVGCRAIQNFRPYHLLTEQMCDMIATGA